MSNFSFLNRKCVKCMGSGMRLEVNEFVMCDCKAGEALKQRYVEPNAILADIPFKRADEHDVMPAICDLLDRRAVIRADAQKLKAMAATMSYEPGSIEATNKHTLNEIAMRLETGFYAGVKA